MPFALPLVPAVFRRYDRHPGQARGDRAVEIRPEHVCMNHVAVLPAQQARESPDVPRPGSLPDADMVQLDGVS